MNNVEAFPLFWPPAWERTKKRSRSQFSTTFVSARDALFYELKRMGVTDIILSSNVELRRDGLPYAGRTPDDPAVAVYFNRKGVQQCIPCDRWDRVQDNIQAIRKTIEALRGLERWGANNMIDAAFRGFKALPASSSPSITRSWWEVLGILPGANSVEIKRQYIKLAQRWHPDKPDGDSAKFAEIKAAYEQAVSTGDRDEHI